MAKTKDEKRLERNLNEKEKSVYDDVGREELKENDEIETWEEGFMEGEEAGGTKAKCAFCGKPTMDFDVVETKINGKVMFFCSDAHLESYKKKKKIP